MKLRYTLFLYLLLISFVSYAQPKTDKKPVTVPKRSGNTSSASTTRERVHPTEKKTVTVNPANAKSLAASSAITGVWRGFFTSGMGFFQDKYKYEVQIGQLNNNGIKGVTYSYRTTVFYGKANLAGMYTPGTKNLILKENKLLEVKMAGGDACLMTCYLEYSKVGNTEVLEGTFTSININSEGDCGSGKVYLEKVPESDFYKEDFIRDFETIKRKPGTTPKTTSTDKKVVVKKDPPKVVAPPEKRKPEPREEVITREEPRTKVPDDRKIERTIVRPVEPPRELKERENLIAKRIYGTGDEITVQLYDNGQIDNDTVTIIHNNQVVVSKKRLCNQPITYKVKVSPGQTRHEFVMYAENLGTIPPNTALMVITIGKQRYDVTITSTNQKNAMVVVECQPTDKETK